MINKSTDHGNDVMVEMDVKKTVNAIRDSGARRTTTTKFPQY